MQAVNVVYDEQMGKYFRIDKKTGETVAAQRNGELLRKFNHEYTGKDYQLRKVSFISANRKEKQI